MDAIRVVPEPSPPMGPPPMRIASMGATEVVPEPSGQGVAPLKDVSRNLDSLKIDAALFTGLLIMCQLIFFVYAAVEKMGYGHNDLTPIFYSMFIHVSIMIFFGFGFLMTFLRRGGVTAVGLCMIVSCVAIELSLVMQGIGKDWAFEWGNALNLHNLIHSLFCAGAIMISMGAVLGKTSPSQLLLMAIMEVIFYWINFGIYIKELEAHDAAGGIVIHTFGAYFGLAVAWVITNPENLTHADNEANYSSDLFSLAGTLFLWLLWPSFCAAIAGDNQNMFIAITNTYIALIGSTMGFAVLSRRLHGFKFSIIELQNATLAGGVAVGVAVDYEMGPFTALALGFGAGVLSTLGYAELDLGRLIGLSDTCGVHNLHGMPGLLGGLVGIHFFDAASQVKGIAVTLTIAISGGLLTGVCLKYLPGRAASVAEYFNDGAYWEVADEHDHYKV